MVVMNGKERFMVEQREWNLPKEKKKKKEQREWTEGAVVSGCKISGPNF